MSFKIKICCWNSRAWEFNNCPICNDSWTGASHNFINFSQLPCASCGCGHATHAGNNSNFSGVKAWFRLGATVCNACGNCSLHIMLDSYIDKNPQTTPAPIEHDYSYLINNKVTLKASGIQITVLKIDGTEVTVRHLGTEVVWKLEELLKAI